MNTNTMESKVFIIIVVAVSALKLLLIVAYRSTDFEVHRNWMAITHSFPLKDWYFDTASEWTLDYPPFFAFFELFLSKFATLFDPEMLQVGNLNYKSDQTILFMRLSVIVCDIPFLVSASLLSSHLYSQLMVNDPNGEKVAGHSKSRNPLAVFALVAFNAGLILVDHIHFQYNGFLMSFLFMSIYFCSSKRYLLAAACFSTLVLMKHLFVLLAPVFAVFLLRHHCGLQEGSLCLSRFVQLVGIAVSAVLLAFGPLVASCMWWGGQCSQCSQWQGRQVLARLFPFGRGLVHAYWAPNLWALYCLADKVLAAVLRLGGVPLAPGSRHSAAGLVGDFQLAVLPLVPAWLCLLLTLLALLPSLRAPGKAIGPGEGLVRSLVLASLSSFLLGYHVHEKAVLTPLLLQMLLSGGGPADGLLALLLLHAGCGGLLPLLPGPQELPLKVSILAACVSAAPRLCELAGGYHFTASQRRVLLASRTALGMQVLLCEGVFPWLLGARLPFLPLMTTSAWCATQLLCCWGLALAAMR